MPKRKNNKPVILTDEKARSFIRTEALTTALQVIIDRYNLPEDEVRERFLKVYTLTIAKYK